MKLQCSCGAKHVFEITQEMAERPVSFKCPACGLDASDFVDRLVRQELGQSQAPIGAPVSIRLSSSEPKPGGLKLASEVRAHSGTTAAARASGLAAASESRQDDSDPMGTLCIKHPGEIAVRKCYICSKPICPKCMELFGHVCSPLCKAKADSHGIQIPAYEGQKSLVEARQWRRIVRVSCVAGALLTVFLGVWFWYAWFGCEPKPVFSVRFDEPSYSGHSVISGKERDQIIFLHGATLARYDMRSKKEVWSVDLTDRKRIDEAIKRQMEATEKVIDKARDEGWENIPKMPSAERLAQMMEREEAAALELHVRGENVWVSSPGKLARFDWECGKKLKELAVQGAGFGGLISRGDELVVVDRDGAKPVITSINLASGESRTDGLAAPEGAPLGALDTGARTPKSQPSAGLPLGMPGRDMGRALDPAKVAEQAQGLPYAAKLALPATLANAMTQERTLGAMEDRTRRSELDSGNAPGSSFSVIPVKGGFVEFGTRLVEQRLVAREAMKPAPGKSALQGNVSASKSMEIANEFLNELQRERGGGVVQDDLSRYEVTVRKPGLEQVWTGEVIGPPQLFPLETVNVIAANQTLVVLDKSNKKLWQSSLGFNLRPGIEALDEETALYGQGPCVEHKGSLYVFDEGVLTAFDLATGNVRWRLPSVGIVGIFFDDQDKLYVNTTTASPDSIKYSRQIDISSKITSVILKLDPKRGTLLWSAEPGGMISYLSGKFLYVVQSHTPEEADPDNPYVVETGLEKPPFLRIKRLNPRNGREVWEHVQPRAPLDVAFEQNVIRLVFKKEVQVLEGGRF
jgi:putative pyrroloquinoline-quinone binding quinoprotein